MENENINFKIKKWKVDLLSENWDIALLAADNLAKNVNNDVFEFLLGLLDSQDPSIRNVASLSLREIKDSRAVDPLLTSIFKAENRNYNGTLVYALEELNCENRLVDIFRILFFESYESKMSACSILNEQIFKFAESDLLEIKKNVGKV